jgi:hypothetical protein
LASLSAKINLARALGIFGPKTAHDLREIRNAFAHGLRRMNFQTSEINQLLVSLHCIRGIHDYKRLSPRKLFFEATAILSTHLGVKAASSSKRRRPPKLERFSEYLD